MFRSSSLVRILTGFLLSLTLATVEANASSQDKSSGVLDSMIFVGVIGPPDSMDYPEELHFNDGQMWTKNCAECGFQPAPYWTRQIGENVHFVSTLTSASGSTFTYNGIVQAGSVQVQVQWTKKRWYWSLERALIFKGNRALARQATLPEQVGAMAREVMARTLPQWCP